MEDSFMSRISPFSAPLPSVLVVALLVVAPDQQSSEGADDAVSDQTLCNRLWEDPLEAVKAGQPARIAFTRDAVLVYPNLAEIRGRDAIHAHLAKVIAGQRILDVGYKMERCEVVGTRAYTFVIVDEQIQEGAAPPARRHARSATVWEQQPDKSWQIAYSLVNYLKI
jgi:ketosteroid isomerase-like protein